MIPDEDALGETIAELEMVKKDIKDLNEDLTIKKYEYDKVCNEIEIIR